MPNHTPQLSAPHLLLGLGLCLGTALLPPIAAHAQSVVGAMGHQAPQGTLTEGRGGWRISQMLGATVHDDQGAVLGTVAELLVAPEGRVQAIVLSLTSGTGLSGRRVEIPFHRLRFAPSTVNPAAHGASASAGEPATAAQAHDFGLVLPGATLHSLRHLPRAQLAPS